MTLFGSREVDEERCWWRGGGMCGVGRRLPGEDIYGDAGLGPWLQWHCDFSQSQTMDHVVAG